MPEARDVGVAGVLGALMLGVSSAAAAVSGAAMGLGLAGVLLSLYASWAAAQLGLLSRGSSRVVAFSSLLWLAGLALLREEALALGLASPLLGVGGAVEGAPAGLLAAAAAAAVGASLVARALALPLPRPVALAGAAAAAAAASAPAAGPALLAVAGLLAGLYSFAEMLVWRGMGLSG